MSTAFSTTSPEFPDHDGASEGALHADEQPSLSDAWRAVSETLRESLSTHSHKNYVLSAKVLPSDGPDILRLGYENEIAERTVSEVYRVRFEEELLRILNRRVTVRVEKLASPGPAPAPQRPELVSVEEALQRKPATPVEPRGRGEPLPSRRLPSGLDTRYDFEAFVVGSSNQFAHAACAAVADSPGEIYNPLFIWGGSGLGKTHLAQAVGLTLSRKNPKMRVVYTTSEQFTNELIDAIRQQRQAEFRKHYRKVDILLVDDVQFFANKPATEEEFFHTFNELHSHNKQIIITSDVRPDELAKMQERLRTRFQWGLVADVQPPEMETRIAILRSKAQSMGMELDDDIIQFMGMHLRQNVRQLEGCLTQVLAYGSLVAGRVTIEAVKDILRSQLSRGGEPVDPEQLMKACAEAFRVSVSEVKGASRAQQIARARQSAMYLTRRILNMSYPEIGRRFGRDHSTVMTAVKRVPELMAKDTDFRRLIETLEREHAVRD